MDKIENSIIAGGNMKKVKNLSDNTQSVDIIIKKARKQSFWISLSTGIVSSLIASAVFNYFV